MRLACVKHAASVRSEPGSNSQVHLKPTQVSPRRPKTNRPEPCLFEASVNAYAKDTPTDTQKHGPGHIPTLTTSPHRQTPLNVQPKGAANVSLPIPDSSVNEQPRRRGQLRSGTRRVVGGGFLLVGFPGVNGVTQRRLRRQSSP